MPKNQPEHEPEELAAPEELLELEEVPVLDAPEVIAPVGPALAAVPGKKPVGVKEVIPFKWKLVGQANGLYLTLFKAVEREDVDAQLLRVQEDGYYTNLRVMDVNEKIEQPKPTKSVKKSDPQQTKEVLKTFGTRTVAKEQVSAKEPKGASSKAAKEAKNAERAPERILITPKIPAKPAKQTKAAASKSSGKAARSSKSTATATATKKKPAASKPEAKKVAKSRK